VHAALLERGAARQDGERRVEAGEAVEGGDHRLGRAALEVDPPERALEEGVAAVHPAALAVEEAPHGIRVNAVCPGGTITRYHIDRAARQGVTEEALRRARAHDNGLFGRWAEPREVAYPILFLSCSESSFITGTTLLVDAGKSVI